MDKIEYKTYQEWKAAGYCVVKGMKARKLATGENVFSAAQVTPAKNWHEAWDRSYMGNLDHDEYHEYHSDPEVDVYHENIGSR